MAIRAAMIPASIGLAGRVSPNPLLVITGQCRRNAKAGEPLADGIATKGSVVIADKAYDSDRIRKSLAASGIIAVIPSRVNRLNPYPVDEAAFRVPHGRHSRGRLGPVPKYLRLVLNQSWN